jgi:preprotein translocase subunit SecF
MIRILFALGPALLAFLVFVLFTGPAIAAIASVGVFGLSMDVMNTPDE